MSSGEIEHLLRKHGFEERRQTGSHKIFFHPERRKISVVPTGRKDLPIGTMKSILKQAGIDWKELLR